MKPDPSIEPTDLFLQFCQKRPYEVRVFRRAETNFFIRFEILTQSQNETAKLRALKFFKEQGVTVEDDMLTGRSLYTNRVACEVLWMACRRVESVEENGQTKFYPFFPSPKHIADECTADEVAQLFESYAQVQYKLGPWEKDINPKDLDEWINRLAIGAMESGFLIRWDSPQLVSLCLMLAEKCHSILTQLPDSPYFLKYLSSNSLSDTTSVIEPQLEGSTNKEPKIEYGETSRGSSERLSELKEDQTHPPRITLKSEAEVKALADKMRNKGTKS